ncbi:MAG: M14 family zinc carboxypeptidase [Gelidibacter sp.]
MKKITFLLILAFICVHSGYAQVTSRQRAINYIESKGEVCFVFTASNEQQIEELSNIISIGHKVNRETLEVEAYANAETFQEFLTYGLPYTVNSSDNEFNPAAAPDYNPTAWDTTWDQYPTYSQYVAKMNYFATTYPSLCTLQSIGNTPNGRQLLVLKISDNASQDEAEPEFLYTSSIHGDELTGYPLMIRLIDYLLSNYGSDTEATNLVNSTEIYICPLANPDGTYRASGNNTISNPIRANANGQDNNRNYPDNIGGIHPSGATYQPEVKAFMAFEASRDFVLAANFHGGTEVVNYPYDNTTSIKHADHDFYERISVEYATNAQNDSPGDPTYMTVEYDSPENPASPGVTQGAIWYTVFGGRQDYMNYYRHSKEVTIELSDTKFIPANQLPNHWNYNKQAFLDFAKQANYGFQGIVTDESGQPIVAQIAIAGHDKLNSYVFSNADYGDYYRLIDGGTYNVTFSAPGYISQTVSVTVTNNAKTIRNIVLVSNTPKPTVSDTSICMDESAMLSASGVGTINWYSNQSNNTPIFSGNNFNTPVLTSNTSYYVEQVISKANVGSTANNNNGGFLGGANRYLIFDCSESVMLKQVTVNASQAGDFEIQLQDNAGNMLDSRIISLSASGIQTIDLNFIIPVGNNLRLAEKEVSSGLTLYRNNANTSYPYSNGSINIKDSSAGTQYYYFFYDWNIAVLKSARKEVTVTVNPKADANFSFEVNPANNGEVTFTNTSTDATSYSWDFGDLVGSSTDADPVYTYTASGTYDVELTSTNPNCGDDVISIPVTVNVETLGVNQQLLNDVEINPNPFNDTIVIKLGDAFENQIVNLKLFDVSGRTILTSTRSIPVNGRIYIKNLNDLSNGTYFITISDIDNSKTVTKQLIKM